MLKNFLSGIFWQTLLCICSLNGQSQQTLPAPYQLGAPVNYIRSIVPLLPESNSLNVNLFSPIGESNITTEYMDGIGRPIQVVIKNGSLNTGNEPVDMVSGKVYDNMGREAIQYLPFPSNNYSNQGVNILNDGLFKYDPFQQQNLFFSNNDPAVNPIANQGESFFYSQTKFDQSPESLVLETFAPGNSWVGTGTDPLETNRRSIKTKYYFNTSTDAVKIWETTNVENGFGNYSVIGTYAEGELNKIITIDESNYQTIQFTDKNDKVILKKVQLTAISDDGSGSDESGWMCTYYIYDDILNLRCVMQPKGVEMLGNNGLNDNVIYENIMNEFCFRYEYDKSGRMITKKVPGAAPVEMVYDIYDRLVMVQDGKMSGNKWMVTKYDAVNRVIETGMWVNNLSAKDHRANTVLATIYPVTNSNYEILTELHYDNYNNLPTLLSSTLNTSNFSYLHTNYNNPPLYAQELISSTNLIGKQTWSKVKVLDGTNNYLYSVNHYDKKDRIIQTQTTNLSEGLDINTTQFDWSGKALINIFETNKRGNNSQKNVVISKNNYDLLGRLVNIKKEIVSDINGIITTKPESGIVYNEYDCLGRIKNKKLAPQINSHQGLENLKFDYNIRGWLLGVNRDYARDDNNENYFGFDLGYDKTNNNLINNSTYSNPQFNGNITGTVWKSKGDGEKRRYDYYYDPANRLLKADFTQFTSGIFDQSAGINFDVKMGDGADINSAYDLNGNIKRMQQWGLLISGSNLIDDLTYNYIQSSTSTESNKLYKVDDAITNNYHLGDFNDGANSGEDDYDYDINGNLIMDLNKSINRSAPSEGIEYNHLNLPSKINFPGKGTISYVYDALGNKLQKQVQEISNNSIKTTLYNAGLVFENDILQLISHEEGRFTYTPALSSVPAKFNTDYFIKDHLGNVRMVLTEEEKIEVYPASTLETSKLPIEQDYYTIDQSQISTSTNSWPTYQNIDHSFGNNPADPTFESQNSTKAYRLTSNEAKQGLGITLKVMAGDLINIYGKSFHFSNSTPGPTNPLSIVELINNFVNSINSNPSTTHGIITDDVSLNNSGNSGIISIMQNQQSSETGNNRPRAFINVILFDEQFKSVDYRVSVVNQDGTLKEHHNDLSNISIPKNGYIYIYCSNESPVNVYFDNVQVIHSRGHILEETHYYPFGLVMQGISSKAAGKLENKFKFQGKELQSKEFSDGGGLEWEDFGARMQDPQLGRWMTIDPLASKYPQMSPYVTMDNNPLSIIDPTGKSGEPVIDKKNKTITVTSNITFYGADGSAALATKAAASIQSQWNAANGKTTIDGVEYSVSFVVTGSYDNKVTADDISKNTDIKNNYVKLVASGIDVSFMDAAGSNTGVFLISNVNDANSTTETHEFGHGFGLEHPTDLDLRSPAGSTTTADAPGIMYPRGTAVDAPYTYDPSKGATAGTPGAGATNTMNPTTRKVNQKDINNLGLDKLTYDPTTGKAQLGKLTNTYH